jgi:hypothetical protein
MDAKRNDSAPAWLVVLAASAFSLSWLVANQVATPRYGWRPAPVLSGSGALGLNATAAERGPRWPLLSLPPIDAQQAQLPMVSRDPSRLAELASRLMLVPAAVSSDSANDPLARLSARELMAPRQRVETPIGWVSRVEAMFAAAPRQSCGLLILAPAEPRWSAEFASLIPSRLAKRSLDPWRGAIGSTAARVGGRIAASSSLSVAAMRGTFDLGRSAFSSANNAYAAVFESEQQLAVAPRRPARSRYTKARMIGVAEYLIGAERGAAYPAPRALVEQLDRVAESPEAAGWAWAVAYQLRGLAGAPSTDIVSVRRSLDRLGVEAAEAARMAENCGSHALAAELRRARFALDRRTGAWSADLDRRVAIAQLEVGRALIAEQLEAMRWAMSSDGWSLDPMGSGHAFGARRVPAASASTTLALAMPQPLLLARRLDDYESGPSGEAARVILEEARELADAALPAERGVAEVVERDYRNANLRIAIAAELVNRLLPATEPQRGVVRDTIAGAPVRGWSTTSTRLAVKLTPDERAWRVALRAQGDVQSDTYSRGGPAVVRSRGLASFSAEKPLVLGFGGISALPAVATAKSGSRLTGLTTSYDRVPLLGSYVRGVARDRYTQVRPRAAVESRVKIERQVAATLEQRVSPELDRLQADWNNRVVARAEKLGLRIDPIELRTTETRLISRVRVANEKQLAAHTPRMRAPSDSVLSVQLHESSINNAVEGLKLAGERMTSQTLRERLAERLSIETAQNQGEDSAVLHFADVDPVRVRFAEGRVELTLSIREMIVRGSSHRNFKVHAFYVPSVNGLRPALVQEGAPQIEGRLRTGARLRLHAAWGKVLGEDRRLELFVPERAPAGLADKLQGLVVSQFVIEDGWLGVAVTPPRHASIAAQIGGYAR